MKPSELLVAMEVAARLKKNTRHCWIDADRKESVADHSWRIALMAMLMENEEEFKDVDMGKVIRMCLIHDLGEAFTGDIPTFLKKGDDEAEEEDVLLQWVNSFNKKDRDSWLSLLQEMKELETTEAKIYKALDKTEALISHNESDLATWLPLEYNLQITYGQENMQFSEYFKEFRELIDKWTQKKITEGE